MKKKIFLYGIGILSSSIEELIDQANVEIIGYIVDHEFKESDRFNDKSVITPEDLKDGVQYDYIVIASTHYDKMYNNLLKNGVNSKQIIGTDVYRSLAYEKFIKNVQKEYDLLFNQSKMNLILSKKTYEPIHIVNMNPSHRNRRILIEDMDYVRYSTLELTAERILENNVEGNVAELGVYKGDFASAINQLFPMKKLFLFDTFDGFNLKDIELENKFGYSKNVDRQLSDTNVKKVIGRMPFPDQCIIKKGYFPETAIDVDSRFSFVSIDTDLYKPIYDGLKYFYPRLNKGGFIFIHDYMNRNFKGVKVAVDQYCKEEGITFSVMSDFYGTAIISR